VFTILSRWFDRRRRNIDREMLFPLIVEKASCASAAHDAILFHMCADKAWHTYSFDQKQRLAAEEVERLWYN